MDTLSGRVTGYKKQQAGLGCEDAVFIREVSDCVIMACADGHGDRQCKHAARGAELAVRVVCGVLEEFLDQSEDLEDLGNLLNDHRTMLAQNTVCQWVEAVLDDYAVNHPEDSAFARQYETLKAYSRRIYEVRDGSMTSDQFRRLARYRHTCENEIYKITLLYGTTLQAAVVCSGFVFAMGIGDGDVIAVNGERMEWLLPCASRFGTSPASLCGNFGNIMDEFYAILVPVTKGRRITDNRFVPELVMLSTDGLRNAFLSDEEFADKMLEIAELFKSGRGHTFARNRKRWLEERSRFSVMQDDVSFCLCTGHSLKRPKKTR